MKKIICLLFGLSLLSLACLQTAMVADPAQTGTATAAEPTFASQTSNVEVGDGFDDLEQGVPAPANPQICAQVIAIEALNVRFGASEQDNVMTWLRSGEVVQVLDRSDRDWWKIERKGVIGFARSVYLQESECEK